MATAKARRPRKRHVQQELFRNGGKRKGAGRKPKGERAGTSHEKRPVVKPYHALHVTLRVASEVGSLRRRGMYHAMREATVVAAVRERIRIVHISLQRTHVHLLIEAENAAVLARGVQGFMISAARNINTLLGDGYRRRRGRVFSDRYHLTVAKTPRHVRNLIGYVLSNGATMVRIEKGFRVPGSWTPFRAASPSLTGRSSRTRMSCGRSARRMIH